MPPTVKEKSPLAALSGTVKKSNKQHSSCMEDAFPPHFPDSAYQFPYTKHQTGQSIK